MSNSRRKFIKNSIVASFGLPILGSSLFACSTNSDVKPLDILILGGTSFLGPHQIKFALSRGHKVSIFTRGKTKSTIHKEVFDQVEHLIGDREDNLSALENRNWDVVIDNSGRKVEWTQKTAELLKNRCGMYLYISSTGVYFPYKKENLDETDSVLLKYPSNANNTFKMSYDYGIMKANSELAASKAFGEDRTIVVRPTYMIGPGDKTDRFIHWPLRLANSTEIMVPGKKNDPVQFADVRDVAEWCIRLAENKSYGTYNAVGPKDKMNIEGFINEAIKTFDKEYQIIHVEDYEFLQKNGVYYIIPWILVDEYSFGSARIDNLKAKTNGMNFRSLQESIKDTYDWWRSDALTDERRNRYLNNEQTVYYREGEILKKWKELIKS
ncbi:MAG: hypothetical protein CMB99_14560 [Flavobacteriaceae bacterium]|nr:hypothetical protein [Flavobacteriaceae bacterium]|tara:strand:- start:210054 stop:211199 length:1146 start_codon:yes stop_codon:yes gene_type:complete